MDDNEKRIAALEAQVAELSQNLEGMAHSIWSEAGTAKACQTAVAVLLSALKVNPLIVQALRDSLEGANEQLQVMAWPPAAYLDGFIKAQDFILTEVGCPPEGQSRSAGPTLQ